MQQAPVKQNPLTYYLRTLLYMFIALLLRLAAFAPLAALLLFPAGSPLRYLAVLCPLLVIFGILPLRFSFAQALARKSRFRYFSFDTALNMGNYGEKLLESLLHFVNVAKWGIPLLAVGVYALYVQKNVDVKTLMLSLMELGKNVTGVWQAIANFFATLFGGAPLTQVAGSLMEGIYTVLAVAGLALAVLLFGAMRNSCNRYIWAVANGENHSTRTEISRRMRGRRWQQCLAGLCNLALWSPFLIVLALCVKDVAAEASTQLMLIVGYGGPSPLTLLSKFQPLIWAFLLLYMPLLPARRILTATFAIRETRHTIPVRKTAEITAETQNVETTDEAQLPPALVPEWVRAENEPENQPESTESGNGLGA
ncbi:MAG: hypothetical protein PHI98_16630 [Eubacteriales bacterium]|nr:hypothetical protein [Eubacteriales bacterium]